MLLSFDPHVIIITFNSYAIIIIIVVVVAVVAGVVVVIVVVVVFPCPPSPLYHRWYMQL